MGLCKKFNNTTGKRICRLRCGCLPSSCDMFQSVINYINIPEKFWNLLPIKDSMPMIPIPEKYGNMYYDGKKLYFCSSGSNYLVKQLYWAGIKGRLREFAKNPCEATSKVVTDYLSGMLKICHNCTICGKKFRVPSTSTICSKCKVISSNMKLYNMGYKPWETEIDIRSVLGLKVSYERHMSLAQYNKMLEEFNRSKHENAFTKDGRQDDRGHGQAFDEEEEVTWDKDEQERSYP